MAVRITALCKPGRALYCFLSDSFCSLYSSSGSIVSLSDTVVSERDTMRFFHKMGNLQDAKALSPLWPGPFSDVGNNARLVADEIKPELGCMGQVVTPFPDDVEDMHDFRFDEGTDDDGFADPRVRFLVRARCGSAGVLRRGWPQRSGS